jgi:hypothetical protein
VVAFEHNGNLHSVQAEAEIALFLRPFMALPTHCCNLIRIAVLADTQPRFAFPLD